MVGVFGNWLLRLSFALLALVPATANAQELLLNRSFETPVTPANGNNFYTTIPDWTVINVTPAAAQPFNVVRPFAGYANNPTVTPTGGGVQYLDINSASGSIRQTITLPSNGMIDISGWFSIRDFQQALTGLNINIRTTGGTLVATTSTSFAATDPLGLWKQAASANIPLAAGSYIFEVDIPNFANVDLFSAVFKPALAVTKTSLPFSDPSNGTTNPKLIPGGITEYTISATAPASYSVSAGTVVIVDATPANTDLVVTDIGGAGSGPTAFNAGTSGMAYSFSGLGNAGDDIDFSNNGGTSWTYAPTANGNGVDPAVTHVRLRPRLTMAAGSTIAFRLRYRIR
jgi:trimeric autotransporter adhesin